MQKFFTYKINVFNQHESPWEGTRICKKKHLKSFTHLRKKVTSKNLRKSFVKIFIEKNIELLNDGGWHFNNLYTPDTISKKLKTFQHTEFSDDKYSNIETIKNKILNLEDLFERNHKYLKINIDDSYPAFIKLNLHLFKDFIH